MAWRQPQQQQQPTKDKQAFCHEQGQFICHIYATINSDESRQTLNDVIQIIKNEQDKTIIAFEGWQPIHSSGCIDDTDSNLHITLIRGHRAIYYHQIRPLVSAIKSECANIKPISLCLNKLKIFHNYEQTKQFLSISALQSPMSDLDQLKHRLQKTVDQFAMKLTNEDETNDTLVHCSLMYRELQQVHRDPNVVESNLKSIENLCIDKLEEYPLCFIKVDIIHVKIGNHLYKLSLTG